MKTLSKPAFLFVALSILIGGSVVRAQNDPQAAIANARIRAMLYLPPKAKRKFKEIAFHENRKEHDIYMEALREYLERKGHKGLL